MQIRKEEIKLPIFTGDMIVYAENHKEATEQKQTKKTPRINK